MKVALEVDEAYPVYKAYSLEDYNADKDSVIVDMDDFDYSLYMAVSRVHKVMQTKIQHMYRSALAREDTSEA